MNWCQILKQNIAKKGLNADILSSAREKGKESSLGVIEFLINNSYVLYANYFYLSIFLLCRLLRNFYC